MRNGEVASELGNVPGGVVSKSASEQDYGQWQVSAKAHQLGYRAGLLTGRGAVGQSPEKLGGMSGRQGIERKRFGVVESYQAAAAGYQDQAVGRARQ